MNSQLESIIMADVLKAHDVIYGQVHRAKIIKLDSDKEVAVIRFDDKTLIPNEMEVPTDMLEYQWGAKYVNPQFKCPTCVVPWKEIQLARFSVFNCPICGAKKEDHLD